ncbi:MAG: hypothetical protein ABIV63_02980, partial [Caldimonas sp.]
EFETWTFDRPERIHGFRGRATPQTQAQPFGLLRDIFAWHFQIADDASLEAARALVERSIVPLFLADGGADAAEAHAHLLGHLIGIDWRDSRHVRGIADEPRQIRNRAFHTAAQVFRRVAEADGGLVMLQLEDLHWADNESLDFIAYLLDVDRDAPMLIVASTRPTLFERRPAPAIVDAMHRRIELSPLDKTGSRLLVDDLLRKLPDVPAGLRNLITGGAEGNPFYMEELVRMLIDQGTIRTGQAIDDAWSVDLQRLLVTRVPGTLTGVLQARLDGLPAAERAALQQASVIGHVFWDQALRALDTDTQATLPALVRKELALLRDDAAFDGLREYVFRHQVLHQVTYDTVLRRTRRELHGKVARWLSTLSGVRAGDFLGVAAEHFERAGDTSHAAEFHARAAEHAQARFAHDAALAHVGRALSLIAPVTDEKASSIGPDAALRWRLLLVREQTFDLQARRDEQRLDLDAMEQLAEAFDDDARRAHAAWRRSTMAMRIADWPACEAAARRGIEAAARVADHGLRLHAHRLLAFARFAQGDAPAGRALAEQGLAEARAHGLRANEAYLLNTSATLVGMLGDVAGSLELDRQSLALFREIGNSRAEAVALANLGAGWTNLGDFVQGRRYTEEALQLHRLNGDRVMEGSALGALSEIALSQGDDARALALARSALDLALASHASDKAVQARLSMADAELALGRHAAARQAFEDARTQAVQIDDALRFDAAAGLARVALALGDHAGALRELKPIFALAAGRGSLDGTRDARLIELTCHRVLAAAGDSRSREWLVRAHENLQAQAGPIPDAALRRGFLMNIPHHRQIVVAWQAAQEPSGR